MKREKLKSLAKSQIDGNVIILFLMGLIVSLCSTGLFLPSFIITLVFAFAIGAPLDISLAHTYLELTSNNKKPTFDMLGFGFKECWTESILLAFWSSLYIILWSLLLVVPGIIKAYSYSMANYIMAENPEIKALDAMKKSEAMMDGYKWELFILDLSFFFWYLLVTITFGIAYIYVGPYIQATKANFYLKLKETQVEEAAQE